VPSSEAKKRANKKWREANPEKHKAAVRAWQKANPERFKASVRASLKRLNEVNPGYSRRQVHASLVKSFEADPVAFQAKKMMGSIRARSKRTGIPTDIDQAWIEQQIRKKCPLTGLPFVITEPGIGTRNAGCDDPWTPSIDQIVHSKGYTKANCRVIVAIANYARNRFTDEDLFKFCDAVVKKRSH